MTGDAEPLLQRGHRATAADQKDIDGHDHAARKGGAAGRLSPSR